MEDSIIGAITAICGGIILFFLKFRSKIGNHTSSTPTDIQKIEGEFKKIDQKCKELTKITESLNKNLADSFLKMHIEYDSIQKQI